MLCDCRGRTQVSDQALHMGRRELHIVQEDLEAIGEKDNGPIKRQTNYKRLSALLLTSSRRARASGTVHVVQLLLDDACIIAIHDVAQEFTRLLNSLDIPCRQ